MAAMIEEQQKPVLICPACGRPMRFARATPGIGGLPELWTFECKACAVAVTEAKSTLLAQASCQALSGSGGDVVRVSDHD